MHLTLKHYVPLGVNVSGSLANSSEAWDALRESDTVYGLPNTRAEWVRRAEQQPGRRAAKAIVGLGYARITSHGVGCGWLEYDIKKYAVHLTCTDIAPRGLAALEKLFTECDAFEVFDIMSPSWPRPDDLHLLHRVDTEASDDQWRTIFANMDRSGLRHVVFVPSEMIGPIGALRHVAKRVRNRLKGQKETHTGWVRSEATFRSFFPASYKVRKVGLGDLTGFLLTR